MKKNRPINHAIREWSPSERPRERMEQEGPERLGNAELLAILLRTGQRGQSAVALAQELLAESGGLRGVDRTPFAALKGRSGLGLAKAAQIKAALELGKRLAQEEHLPLGKTLKTGKDVVEALWPRMREWKKEVFLVVLLDTKHRVVGERVVSVGSLSASLVHPREVMKAVVEASAAAFVAVHNHPSGEVTPSPDDRDITERLMVVAELMGVTFLDHVIIGDGTKKYFSFFENRLIASRKS